MPTMIVNLKSEIWICDGDDEEIGKHLAEIGESIGHGCGNMADTEVTVLSAHIEEVTEGPTPGQKFFSFEQKGGEQMKNCDDEKPYLEIDLDIPQPVTSPDTKLHIRRDINPTPGSGSLKFFHRSPGKKEPT